MVANAREQAANQQEAAGIQRESVRAGDWQAFVRCELPGKSRGTQGFTRLPLFRRAHSMRSV